MTNLNDQQEARIAELIADAAASDSVLRPVRYEEVYRALREMNADFRRKLSVARLWFDAYDPADDATASPSFWIAAYEVGLWLDSSNQHDELAEFTAAALARNVMIDDSGSRGMVRWLLADAVRIRNGESVDSINEYLTVLRPALNEIEDPLFRGRANLQFARTLIDLRRLATMTDSLERLAAFTEAESCLDQAVGDSMYMHENGLYLSVIETMINVQLLQHEIKPESDVANQLGTVRMAANLVGTKHALARAALLTARVYAAQGRVDEALVEFAKAERPSKKFWMQSVSLESRLHRATVLDELDRHDEAAEAREGARGLLSFYKIEHLEPLLAPQGGAQ